MSGRESESGTANTVAVLAITALVLCSGFAGVVQPVAADHGHGHGSTTHANVQQMDSYVVEQGDQCQPIEPLSTDGTVGSFYDYRNHETHDNGTDRMYSSYGTTHLQENNTSALFLHQGTDGLSLVMVHDRLDGGTTGGVASFDIVGVPSETEWVVQDDLYDGETNMAEWHDGPGRLGADWIWSENRTDGGAIQGGLNDAFAVTVQPDFNEDAAHYENESLYDPDFHGNGTIDDWDVLSGDADDPDRTTLSSLEEPVTVRTGTCDDPSMTYERTDDRDGVTAHIDGAAADDRLALQPTTGTADNVTFEGVELTGIDDAGSVTFENGQVDDLPNSPDDVESLSQLSISGDSTADASATVSFSVNATHLEEQDLDADDIALYEADGGEWSQVETTVTDRSAAEYRFSADVTSLEGLAVAEQQPTAAGSAGGEGSSMPGFATGTAVAALLLAVALAAARGRD